MSQPVPVTPSVSWRRRALRRTAGSLGAAVVIAAVVPAVANAAGAHVGNPVAFALRSSGHTLASAFGADETETPSCGSETPVATESAVPTESAAPTETTSETPVATEPAATESPVGTEAPVESAEPTESAEPSESVEPAAEPSESAEASDCDTPDESASPEPTESASESADREHGQIVSTVAHCAPHGKDPLLDVEGAPGNHGGYVSVAAHGGSLTTPWGTFDLSTQAGADELCAAVAAARDALPTESASPATHGKHGGHGKPEHATHGNHGHGKGHEDPAAGSTTDGSEPTAD